jgi:hypothetical protein
VKRPREYTLPEIVLVSLVVWVVAITVSAGVIAWRLP